MPASFSEVPFPIGLRNSEASGRKGEVYRQGRFEHVESQASIKLLTDTNLQRRHELQRPVCKCVRFTGLARLKDVEFSQDETLAMNSASADLEDMALRTIAA